ncbi:6-aminohexanoate-dimer hydrolase [Agaricicola taiwanensis]|uniref:6-aminohexanoate-dimer hydrolase n=1 Tax=Agaricicola taiwanensis TaxID=591372 RepID=A0A8J2YAS0_9RHOB|nr:serine hydrolase [Agaricicola taiwanensis]GGE30148.1 6-aminohexanoate-dimer hydrolase [Agaricicola taiwanensis]
MLTVRSPLMIFLRYLRIGFAAASLAAASVPAMVGAAELTSESSAETDIFAATRQRGEALPHLNALMVARDGEMLLEERFAGPSLDRPVNIKSASKSVLSALVGIAIERGVLTGLDQKLATVLADRFPEDPDPRLYEITVEDLLSMRAGLQSTSGPNFGSWIASRDWVRDALARPFEDDPGGRMIYSTGSSHLLAAMLTKASGRPLLELAKEWLGEPLDITIPRWPRDRQGIYRGGNDMELSARSLLAFGELYRNGGIVRGLPLLPNGWVETSWEVRTTSPWSGHGYGYGWYSMQARGHQVHFAWGYGGQMVYVVPDLNLTVVMTSDAEPRPARDRHIEDLHALLADAIIPAVSDGD